MTSPSSGAVLMDDTVQSNFALKSTIQGCWLVSYVVQVCQNRPEPHTTPTNNPGLCSSERYCSEPHRPSKPRPTGAMSGVSSQVSTGETSGGSPAARSCRVSNNRTYSVLFHVGETPRPGRDHYLSLCYKLYTVLYLVLYWFRAKREIRKS